jgi:uncharacterized protein YpmS
MDDFNSSDKKEKVKKKKNWKNKVLIFLILIIILFSVYIYFQYKAMQELRSGSQELVEKADKYEIISEKIQLERSRCENFIIREEGDFGSFEYCKKFIDWSNK